jgi:hypothetical protein
MMVVTNFDDEYAKYVARVGGEAMSRREFGINVAGAMRRGDKSDITEVSGLARTLRKQFEADRKAFEELGVLPEDIGTLGAESYFPRVYDHNAIQADLPGFTDRLFNWFRYNPKLPKESKEVKEARGRVGDAVGASFANVEETLAKSDAAKVAAKKSVDALKEARRTRIRNVSPLRAVDREMEDLSRTLQELEDKRSFLAEEMSGATPEQLARAEAKVDREITKVRERGIKAGEKRTKLADEAIAADESVAALRTAAKEARLAAKKAKKAADEAKADAKAVRDFDGDVLRAKTAYQDPAEIADRVQKAIENILGTTRANADLGRISNPKVTKERALDVPDHILEPYLVSDLDQVMSGYIRSVAPNIEMRKAFGNIDLKPQTEEISEVYRAKKIAAGSAMTKSEGELLAAAKARNDTEAVDKLKGAIDARNKKEVDRLTSEHSDVLNAIEGMRLRLLNQVGPKGSEAIGWVRTGRILRQFNMLRMLGTQTVSSMADLGHIVSKYGLRNTGKALAKFVTNVNFNKLTRADSRRMHVALDWVLDTRSGTLADIAEDLSGGQRGFAANLERVGQRATQQFTRLSLMATWNSTLKNLTSILEQDAILRGAANPSSLSKIQRAKIAQLGLGESDLKVIAEQFAKHGETTDGMLRASTELWDKEALGVARKLESAIIKAGEIMSISKGVGDTPLLMDKELVKTLLQFKTFGVVSVNRLMIPVAQGLAHGDMMAANGLGVMLGLGALSQYTKDIIAGREPETDPASIVSSALLWSGALGYIPDVWDPATVFMPGPLRKLKLSRFKDSSPLDTLMGPSFGTASDFITAWSGLMKPADEDSWAPEVSASDVHRTRRLLPLQNLAYIYRLVNALEGEFADSIDAEGATYDTFGDRLTESKPAK